MKKTLSFLCMASTLCAAGLVSSISVNADSIVNVPIVSKIQNRLIESDNLIENGDFSNGFDNWRLGGTGVTLLNNDHGNYVRVLGAPYSTVDQSISIDVNSVYEVSFLAYALPNPGALQINKYLPSGGRADVEHVRPTGDYNWERFSTIINNGAKKYQSITLQFNAQNMQNLSFTDVVVKKIA